jgi:DNA topoisomerase-1
MYLLITESPAKAKKIQGFLNGEYKVLSSCGHIRDLDKKKTKVYGDPKSFGIDVDNDFKPKYVIMSDKRDIVKNLKAAAVDREIIFAADDDREGEAIAWHTAQVLKSSIKKANRIVFREISQKAIIEALKTPQRINMNEVNSQQARRIIDRLIGFKLSPCLWKNISTNEKGLSAGRVQSALLNLLEQRDNYILNFKPQEVYTIEGTFTDFDKSCTYTKLPGVVVETESLFEKFAENRCFRKLSIEEKKVKDYPEKPFITSTLQQTASRSIGLSIKQTMNIAQKLYEGGHITYMRTDSMYISDDFSKKVKKYIGDNFNTNDYCSPGSKKVKGAQEAHEAIRVTSMTKPSSLTAIDMKLYNLIYDRTITSHMKPCESIVYRVKITNKTLVGDEYLGYFTMTHKRMMYPGYKIYYDKTLLGQEDKPDINETYILEECVATQKTGNTPQYYDEGSIVSLLEKTGIGRPSTYSSIVSTLDNRKYTEKRDYKEDDKEVKLLTLSKEDELIEEEKIVKGNIQKNRILITPLGIKVLDYLRSHFMNIIHETFTSQVEDDLDLVANGELNYVDVIRKVYDSFITIVDDQMKNTTRNVMDMPLLGKIKGKEIFIGNGKFGPYMKITGKSVKNMNISHYLKLVNKRVEDFTIEDAGKVFSYPKKINDSIYIFLGPHGFYMKYNGTIFTIEQRRDGEYSEEYCMGLV